MFDGWLAMHRHFVAAQLPIFDDQIPMFAQFVRVNSQFFMITSFLAWNLYFSRLKHQFHNHFGYVHIVIVFSTMMLQFHRSFWSMIYFSYDIFWCFNFHIVFQFSIWYTMIMMIMMVHMIYYGSYGVWCKLFQISIWSMISFFNFPWFFHLDPIVFPYGFCPQRAPPSDGVPGDLEATEPDAGGHAGARVAMQVVFSMGTWGEKMDEIGDEIVYRIL